MWEGTIKPSAARLKVYPGGYPLPSFGVRIVRLAQGYEKSKLHADLCNELYFAQFNHLNHLDHHD